MKMKSDSELDSLGRESKHEHEWSEWVEVISRVRPGEDNNGRYIAYVAPIKIRICKRCKQLQGDLV